MRINALGFYQLYLLALLGALIWAPGTRAVSAQTNTGAAKQDARIDGEPTLLTDKDTVVLADFDNKTGDAIFDDAHYQLGRAYAAAHDTAKAKAAYREFFKIWKDADPEIAILKEAKAEYATL